MDLNLKDKQCLIIGASRGLGFATAKTLSEEGAWVAINSRSADNIQAAARRLEDGGAEKVLALPGDVHDPEVPAKLVAEVVNDWGGLDILITNSGGPPAGSFEVFTDEDWMAAFQLLFMSHVRLIRAALPYLRKSEAPSVLTITSNSVKQPIASLVLSNSIRAATVGLTKTLAIELGSEGIRFNSILPGWTRTERVDEIMAYRAQTNNSSVEAEIDKTIGRNPLRRMGEPAEFGRVAAFLVSPAASYVNGVMLQVDGGSYAGLL